MNQFSCCHIYRIPRLYNQKADALAEAALTQEQVVNMTYVPKPPSTNQRILFLVDEMDGIDVVQIEDPFPFYEQIGRLIAFNEYPVGSTMEERKRLLQSRQPFSMVPILGKDGQTERWELYRKGCDRV